jgi:hypothetical protein
MYKIYLEIDEIEHSILKIPEDQRYVRINHLLVMKERKSLN